MHSWENQEKPFGSENLEKPELIGPVSTEPKRRAASFFGTPVSSSPLALTLYF
jgi:hypothetical protein